MSKEPWKRGLVAMLVAIGGLTLTVPAAQASVEHPKLIVNGEQKRPGVQTPFVAWGTIQLKNHVLGFIECVNLVFGQNENETEPGRAGGGTESVRAIGEVQEWTGTSYSTASGLELSPRCHTGSGFQAWAAVEPTLMEETEKVRYGDTEHPSERAAVRQVKREVPSVPWKGETQGTEIGGTPFFYIRTGIAINPTERSAVETEEASVGIPKERRSGCYPQPALTEITRQPGYTTEGRETELELRHDPPGCIRVDIVAPELSLETPFQGTLEPEATNGARNSLTPSSGSFKGGCDEGCEHSSERNEYNLVSKDGPGYTKSILPIKVIGALREELLTIK